MINAISVTQGTHSVLPSFMVDRYSSTIQERWGQGYLATMQCMVTMKLQLVHAEALLSSQQKIDFSWQDIL